MARFLSLEQYSPRALNLIATLLSGHDTRVVLTRRLEDHLAVVLGSRTVLLDPDRTGLYDLVLGAQLLARRVAARRGGGRPRRRFSPAQIAHWAAEAQTLLARRYPGITRLPGRYHPGRDLAGLAVVWEQVQFRPPRIPPTGPGEGDVIPDVEITGAEEDFAALLEALREGRLHLEEVPGLEGVPVLTFPVNLLVSHQHGPHIERLEEHIAAGASEIRDLMDCYRRKSENLDELAPLGRLMLSGTRFDSSRLVEAVLARRTGVEPRLFRRPRADFEPIFDPTQHLVLIALDLNDLQQGPYRDPTPVYRFLAWILSAYRRLEVDCVVLGFADHLLSPTPDSYVYAHVPVVLKDIREEFDATFWNRLAHVMGRPPQLPQGTPACFQPLLMRTIGRWFDRLAREESLSYRSILLWAKRGMPSWWLPPDETPFWTRTARLLEDAIEEIRAHHEGTLDTQGCFVPAELKEAAPPNGVVAKMF